MYPQNVYELFRTLHIQQPVIPNDVQLKACAAFTQFQKFGNTLAKQMNCFQAKDVTHVSQTLIQIQDIMQPLINLYPQLEKLNHSLKSLSIPEIIPNSTAVSTSDINVTEATAELEKELYGVTQSLVDKALAQEIIQDELPDENVVQETFFTIAYYASTLTTNELLNWSKQLLQLVSTQIKSAGNQTISGLLNIYAILDLIMWICASLKCYL